MRVTIKKFDRFSTQAQAGKDGRRDQEGTYERSTGGPYLPAVLPLGAPAATDPLVVQVENIATARAVVESVPTNMMRYHHPAR